MCRDILDHGTSSESQVVRPKWEDGASAHTIKQFCVVNRYNLEEEFPILTLRPTNLKAAIDEILWIWQKKSNNIKDLNSHIWDSWADETGSIGTAYGYQLGVKHQYSEGLFDQVDRVLYDLAHNPYSRRMITNIYNHQDLHSMNLYPCAYSMTFNVTGNKLNGILNQRSNDILVANNWNVVQYAILLQMFAQVSGFVAGEFVHVIADAHIYDRHVPLVEELISRKTYEAPRLIMNKAITNFYDFTVDDFKLEGYEKGPQIKGIPVAI
jgi:thymidylate synthase